MLDFLSRPWRTYRLQSARTFSLKTEVDMLDAAYASAPAVFRWFGFSLRRGRFRTILPKAKNAAHVAEELKLGAKVWPFLFNESTLAMRKGYVLVRDNKPRVVILTELS